MYPIELFEIILEQIFSCTLFRYQTVVREGFGGPCRGRDSFCLKSFYVSVAYVGFVMILILWVS